MNNIFEKLKLLKMLKLGNCEMQGVEWAAPNKKFAKTNLEDFIKRKNIDTIGYFKKEKTICQKCNKETDCLVYRTADGFLSTTICKNCGIDFMAKNDYVNINCK